MRESSNHSAIKRDFQPTVYIMASARNGTLYIGATSNLILRNAQHREGTLGGFTKKHGVKMLVWFEQHATMVHAITREKQLKKWNRGWKLKLIEQGNPSWCDRAAEFGFEPLR